MDYFYENRWDPVLLESVFKLYLYYILSYEEPGKFSFYLVNHHLILKYLHWLFPTLPFLLQPLLKLFYPIIFYL